MERADGLGNGNLDSDNWKGKGWLGVFDQAGQWAVTGYRWQLLSWAVIG